MRNQHECGSVVKVFNQKLQMEGFQMTLKEKYDVVIVGSGPAGAGAAKALSGSGLDILVVERQKMPRYKMCSGIVFPSSRKFIEENFGEIPRDIMCTPEIIKGNRVFVTNEDPVLEVSFDAFDAGEDSAGEGFNTWRSDLDQWLISQSDAAVADDCSFESFQKSGDEYQIQVNHRKTSKPVTCRYIIGADGTLSRVRKTLYPDFNQSIVRIPNYEEIYTGTIELDPGWLYLFMDRSVTGYFATIFHKDDKIAVVTGVNEKESVKEYFKVFKTHLLKNHGLQIKETYATHGIVLTDMSAQKNYCLGDANVLLSGEAAGFLRGGEGITSSLASGYAAGKAVVESEQSGKPAIDYYLDLAADELKACETVHATLTEVMGYNVFMRP